MPLLVADFERTLIHSYLVGQPNNYSAELARFANGEGISIAPRHVPQVEEFIEAHPERKIDLRTPIWLTGTSASGIYAGFKRFRGYKPFALLKRTRLTRVRTDLLAATTANRVTDIALRWGFAHLGRFSADYRAEFGELPSETLRRAPSV